MILINESCLYKKITYFDIELIVPFYTNWVATDETGEVHAMFNKPTLQYKSLGIWVADNAFNACVANVDLEGVNWRKTLRKI